MNGNRVLRRATIVALAGAMLGLGGCAHWNALMQADRIEREARAGEVRALHRQSDAYFLIGMEYYNLARAAEKAGEGARAKDCATKAGLYNALAKSLAREAEEARMAPASADSSAGAPAAAAAPSAPGVASPVAASVAAPTGSVAAPPAGATAGTPPQRMMAPAPVSSTTLPELPSGAAAVRSGNAARSRP